MNTEQKAKAYDIALNEAVAAYKDEDKHLKATLERIFPVLKESKDEKIRKVIIGLLKQSTYEDCDYDGVNMKDIYAWLKGQGEKQITWTDNDRIMAFSLLRDVEQMTTISKEGKNDRLEWLNSLEDKFNKI